MEKGKCENIVFAIMESHLHIKENPKASTRRAGSLSPFISNKNAGCCLHVECVWTKVVT